MQPMQLIGRGCQDEIDMRSVQHHFTGVFKIYRDLATNVGLHLPQPPIRLCGVAHKLAGLEQIVKSCHGASFALRARVMSDPAPFNLVALLGSRICHDLISRVGAIGNGLELLDMAGGQRGPELALISESFRSADARLRLFRIAFGRAAPGQLIRGAELAAVLTDVHAGTRVAVAADLPRDVARADAKLALLIAQCMAHVLPIGGTLALQAQAEGWRLSAKGPRVAPDPALWAAFPNPPPSAALDAANVEFALVAEAAAEAGRAPIANPMDGALDVTF